MADKEQIMINGVDVSGCKYYLHNTHKNCGVGLVDCEGKDCIFKQLARKTQECDELKEEYEALKLENQELYTILAHLKEVRKLKDEYVQKCEKLKSQVDEDYNYYTTELKTLRDTISNKEKRNAALFLTCGHYRTAMEEIEEYLKLPTNVCLTDCPEYSIGQVCSQNCFDNRLKILLDIINKAKGEE